MYTQYILCTYGMYHTYCKYTQCVLYIHATCGHSTYCTWAHSTYCTCHMWTHYILYMDTQYVLYMPHMDRVHTVHATCRTQYILYILCNDMVHLVLPACTYSMYYTCRECQHYKLTMCNPHTPLTHLSNSLNSFHVNIGRVGDLHAL